MSKNKGQSIGVPTDRMIFIGIGIITVIILVGGIWLVGSASQKEQEKLNKPLMGDAITIKEVPHIKDGESHPPYDSNPPTSGWMYDGVAGAGIHDTVVADELLVHSMEHGAVIVHYKSDLPKDQLDQVKAVFNEAVGKKILVPRENLDTPLALTSWGRLLALQTVDAAIIKSFIETNENRGPEKVPMY